MISSTQRTGEYHEKVALKHLTSQGLKLVERNFRCRNGEIDLIFSEAPASLVFVEVRFRKSTSHGSAAATITATKQRRIRQAATIYLQKNKALRFLNCRFDVVAIQRCSEGRTSIDWIKNAFY